MKFSELYGKIETVIRETDGGGNGNRMSRGKTKSKSKTVKPGVTPGLFGRHLIGNAIFLSLEKLASNLPKLREIVVPVPMGDALERAYTPVAKDLKKAVAEMLRNSKGADKRLLGTMLQTLLAYPDHPFGWEPVGYYERGPGGGRGAYITVTIPDNLSRATIYPKEAELIRIIREERAKGRQCWVYVQFTDRHDVEERLRGLLEQQGFKVECLRSSVLPKNREDWINKHAPGADVVISHPKLVETGLDLFDKGGRHNFPTLIFYETGYNLFTLRQASRRSWRIGQRKACRVYYLYYSGTLQEGAMTLMGKKMEASQAIEGKFSSEGLAAMANDDGQSIEMALAKSLERNIDHGSAERAWAKVVCDDPEGDEPVILPMRSAADAEALRQQRLARVRARLAAAREAIAKGAS